MRIMNRNSGADITGDFPRVVKWVFFTDGKILYSHTGWGFQGNIAGQGGTVGTIYIDPPKRAIKLNLSRQENFWMKHTERFSTGDTCCLYIYVRTYKEGQEQERHATKINHYRTLYLPVMCGGEGYGNTGAGLTLRDWSNSEETDFGKEVAKFQMSLEAHGLNCDNFDVEKFLTLFNKPSIKEPFGYVVQDTTNRQQHLEAGGSYEDMPEPKTLRVTPDEALELKRKEVVWTQYTGNRKNSLGQNLCVLIPRREFVRDNPENYWELIKKMVEKA